jgi:hypothetical protein
MNDKRRSKGSKTVIKCICPGCSKNSCDSTLENGSHIFGMQYQEGNEGSCT